MSGMSSGSLPKRTKPRILQIPFANGCPSLRMKAASPNPRGLKVRLWSEQPTCSSPASSLNVGGGTTDRRKRQERLEGARPLRIPSGLLLSAPGGTQEP